jgi:serine/threonine protein kinase
MQVRINGQSVQLENNAVIGVGGEATVFKLGSQAVKVYIAPDEKRGQKLQQMLPKTNQLPDDVIAPQHLVYDDKGKAVVGFTMRLLDTQYIEVRELTKKQYRTQTGISAKDVARLFLRIGETLQRIHQAGMVVGDLNDLNIMFHAEKALFIDVDSFQFDSFPCMVGTEAFTDPKLYGVNFANHPAFSPENDWYSFAVLLFKALLLTHPYGGVHPKFKLLPHRAQQQISVFNHDVTYPKIAYAPELLSDKLQAEFRLWFDKGKRTVFPLDLLHDYINNLNTCPNCDAAYPNNRNQCPVCSEAVPVDITMAVAGARTILRTTGEFIAWHITPNEGRFIAHEDGKAVLYILQGEKQVKRVSLFDAIPTATYAFMGDTVIVAPDAAKDDLLLVNVAGDKPQGAQKLTTAAFGQGERVFGANATHLYRIANGYLMQGEYRYGQFVEKALMAVADKQTWFAVAPDADVVFGLFRTFNNHAFWLLKGNERIDVKLPQLEQFEFMTEINVKFGADSLLVLRQTQFQGVERVRIDEVSYKGDVRHTTITRDVEQFTPLDAHAYAKNMLLIATDKGVIRETLDSGSKATFTQTEQIVQPGNRLFRYGSGLVALGDSTVIYVTV